MTAKEIKEQIKQIEQFTKKVTASPKASLDFLVKAGICNTSGKLRKEYK